MHYVRKLLYFLILTRIILFLLPLSVSSANASLWNLWDGPHYIFLSEHGYTNIGAEAKFIVFFPLYPLFTKILALAVGNHIVAAVTLSTFCFIFGAIFFYKLVKLHFPEKTARWAVIFLAIFPTSYFFNAVYTESLFLLLFSASFYFFEKRKWLAAGMGAACATLTRPVGIIVTLALVFELLRQKKDVKSILIILVPSIFTISLYLLLNYTLFKNPLAFQEILQVNWFKSFALPHIGILASWQRLLSQGLNYDALVVGFAEALTSTLAWVLVPIAFLKLPFSWAVFYSLSVLSATSTGFILSMPRYLLSIPPFFILVAILLNNTVLKTAWVVISITLLVVFTLLFTTGQWAF